MDDFLTHQHSDELRDEIDLELEREYLMDSLDDTYRTSPRVARSPWFPIPTGRMDGENL